MIPKIIHYCWFGRNPLPESAIKCIDSWKKYFPGYEIKEWNEDNFDVNIIPYTAEAYEAKKYAFVSDYARFWILYRYGGLYFDTDVEVIKPMDDIVARGPFMGIEVETPDSTTLPLVAPGLGLGATSEMALYKEILDYYQPLHFLDADGKPSQVTVVKHNTNVLKAHGMRPSNELQQVGEVWIYPRDYFNPLNDNTGVLDVTPNTRSIHWYTKTWLPKRNPLKAKLSRWLHRHFGDDAFAWTRKFRKH
ncbi:MAG: glycosyltransferase [Bacteroidales bacterium]|nr:glycosyltransferase [Bacteroidales bacterium]